MGQRMIHIITEVKEVQPRKKEQNSYPIHTYSTHPASVPRDGPHEANGASAEVLLLKLSV